MRTKLLALTLVAVHAFRVHADDVEVLVAKVRGPAFSLYAKQDSFAKEEPIGTVLFSHDGKTLAAASQKRIRLWDIETREDVGTLRREDIGALDATCGPLAFSPSGQRVVAPGPPHGALAFWHTRTCRAERPVFASGAERVVFSPDGSLIAATSSGKIDVVFCDGQSGRELDAKQAFHGLGDVAVTCWQNAVAFGERGSLIWVTFDEEKACVHRFDPVAKKVESLKLQSPDMHPEAVKRNGLLLTQISLDGRRLLRTCDEGRRLCVWDCRTGAVRLLPRQSEPIRKAVFSWDGALIAATRASGGIDIWDAETMRKKASLRIEASPLVEEEKGREDPPAITSVAFSPNTKMLAVGLESGRVAVFALAENAVNLKKDATEPEKKTSSAPRTLDQRKIIVEYEKLGGVYGGWVRGDSDITSKFVAGPDAAKMGLPGFAFRSLPNDALPNIDVSFGLQWAHRAATVDLLSKLPKKHLSALVLRGASITDDGMKSLAKCEALSLLYLSGAKVGDAGMAEIRSLIGLRELGLDATRVTDAGLKHLSMLPTLTTLDLAECRISGKGLEHLVGTKTLTSLSLSGTSVGDTEMKVVATMRRLQRLHVGYSKITDQGVRELASLGELRVLYLDGTRIGDGALSHLKHHAQLRSLFLRRTEFTKDGVRSLTTLPKLRFLALDHNDRLDAECLRMLAGCKSLASLSLAYTELTDQDLLALAAVPTLVSVNLAGCGRITENGMTQLQSLLPNCKILR